MGITFEPKQWRIAFTHLSKIVLPWLRLWGICYKLEWNNYEYCRVIYVYLLLRCPFLNWVDSFTWLFLQRTNIFWEVVRFHDHPLWRRTSKFIMAEEKVTGYKQASDIFFRKICKCPARLCWAKIFRVRILQTTQQMVKLVTKSVCYDKRSFLFVLQVATR